MRAPPHVKYALLVKFIRPRVANVLIAHAMPVYMNTNCYSNSGKVPSESLIY